MQQSIDPYKEASALNHLTLEFQSTIYTVQMKSEKFHVTFHLPGKLREEHFTSSGAKKRTHVTYDTIKLI